MEGTKRLTLEALIAKKEQREAAKIEYKEVYVEELGGTIQLKKMPLSQLLEMLNQQEDNPSLADSLAFEIDLIYKGCPIFQDKRLQAAYECVEPTDIVCKVLNDNLGAVADLSAKVLDFYGLGDAVGINAALKN